MSRLLISSVDSKCPHILRRCMSATASFRQAAETTQSPTPAYRPLLDPENVSTPRLERKLLREKSLTPVGSRRRRALIREGHGVPFEQQPYQCFQEARQILVADRQEKMAEIQRQRERIQRLREQSVPAQKASKHERRITSIEQRVERLKILADINDPTVKRIYEDGKGDLNKPIYRFLAERQWKSYKKKILDQRIEQMRVVPDVLPRIDISMDMEIYFGGKMIDPGSFVDSGISELPPRLRLQAFNKGDRLVSIAIVTPDIPCVATDSFTSRLHYLVCNVKLSPTDRNVIPHLLSRENQVVTEWLPPYSQKRAPYQRLAIIVLEQDAPLSTNKLREQIQRDGFSTRSFVDKHGLKPVSAGLFRSNWDENTPAVMQRLGVPGYDVEFKRNTIQPLPYQRLDTARYR